MFALMMIVLAWQEPTAPETRALSFLVREVPAWSRDNHCFSCHNNGDAARALFEASRRAEFRKHVPDSALADTLDWLRTPGRWHEKDDAEFHDRRLASIAFAQALAAAPIDDRAPLKTAARQLAAIQADDGSFPIDGPDAIGAPATYGRPLATAIALQTLRKADRAGFDGAIRKGQGWIRSRPIRNTLDAAAYLLADPEGPRAAEAVGLLRQWQGEDGGWGPYPNSPPEVFDTAIALLALASSEDRGTTTRQRGRAFLIQNQRDDGSWPGTTRPPNGESYAERLATAGWATLALLATPPMSDKRPPSAPPGAPLRYRSGSDCPEDPAHPEPTRSERSTP